MKTKKTNLSVLLVVALALAAAFSTTGCRNTAHGVGEDIERVGDKIQDKTD